MILIRRETQKDYETVCSVIQAAFRCAQHTDGHEHELARALRKSDAFLPDLSLIAETDGIIVGHILFTRATVEEVPVLALAPLSVLPEYQRKGIGTALIQAGHGIAAKAGYGYSVVLGHADYYPRMGYVPARTFGIHPPFDVPEENFMACKIRADAPSLQGVIQYAREFGIA